MLSWCFGCLIWGWRNAYISDGIRLFRHALVELRILTKHVFAEVKALKSLVRNVIAPNRDLGHTDRALKKNQAEEEKKDVKTEKGDGNQQGKKDCEDCS